MDAFVLGSGGWGTALALLLLENGHRVSLWSPFESEVAALTEKRENPLLPGVALPEVLNLTGEVSDIVAADLAVMAVPSFAVRETARKIAPYLKADALVVSVAKGIERGSSLRMSQVIREELGEKGKIVVLSGPSHAEEVGRGVPTGCVAAASERSAAEAVQDAFMNQRFRVYCSDDTVGVEIGAALKNVIALSCGVCDGMGLGDNTKAMLVTRGLTEMARLGMAMGGRRETFLGLAGVGDLTVTCTSMHSRNRRAGILIGQGKTTEEALKEVGAVVEGYYCAENARDLARSVGAEMPIAEGAYQVLYQGKSPIEVLKELMLRDKKDETEECWS